MLKDFKNFKLPELEERVLAFWKKNRIFEKTLALRAKAKPFRFFEGPPSANAQPGTHHALSRAFKDIICRYQTMRGRYVLRKAGWDAHGLPIELAAEKELGFKSKAQIEKFGIAEFNIRCRLLVWKYKSDWEKLTERIGYWLDFKNPYITSDNGYIESLWWIFKQIDKSGLLKKLFKVVPWCPRCQTPLSNHELGQPDVYRKTRDPSVYVKFRLFGRKREYFLVWTTTPWTLPANLAIAVNPKFSYTKYKVGDEFLWSLNPPPKNDGVEISVVEKLAGSKLIGLKYEPLYKTKNPKLKTGNLYTVLAADFVSTEEGTGLVHVAPAFGEDDLKLISLTARDLAKPDNIPITIDERGMMKAGLPGAGKFIKEADRDIISDLLRRQLLYKNETIEHEYPHCWRCSTPLIYFARLSWFIEMSRLKDELVRANEKINWIPAHLKDGRFGDWLREGKDWSISRERYWGTPLPIWECRGCGKHTVVGSYEELNDRAFHKNQFYFVRHAEAEHNVKGALAFVPETSQNVSRLTGKGRLRAQELALELKKHKISVVFSSPFARARETAKIIAKAAGVKVIYDQRLSEINTGFFNGRPVSEFHKFFGNFSERFSKRPQGGEHLGLVKKRMLSFLKEINQNYRRKKIVIVSHGDPLWVLEAALKGASDAEVENYPSLGVGEWRQVDFPNWPFDAQGFLDWHRPFVDEIFLECGHCGKKMRRVREVADVWFDSGAMPYAEWHYPFENKELITRRRHFPADYIAEGMDQTRGWFYTMLAIAALLKLGPPYLNVISTGLVLDKQGQKMSKSRGNVVDPWLVVQKYGADVLRWYFYTINDPGDPKRFDEADLLKIFRKFHLLFWNSFVFLKTYEPTQAKAEKSPRPTPPASELAHGQARKSASLLDRWVLARWNETLSLVTQKMDRYEIVAAARELQEFVDDLSRWYIRRSRARFANPENRRDFVSALTTLNRVLSEFATALAPFCPFFAEAIHLTLKKSGGAESVHLESWPTADKKAVDKKLISAMAETRRLASAALALRAERGIKVRQPLAALKSKVQSPKSKDYKDLLAILKDEVNVKEIIFGAELGEDKTMELTTEITPELYKEGVLRELVRMIQKIRRDAGCKVGDLIDLYLGVPGEIKTIVAEKLDQFKAQLKAKEIKFFSPTEQLTVKFDAELETKFDDKPVLIKVKKL